VRSNPDAPEIRVHSWAAVAVWRENRQAVEDALPELKTENFRSPKDAAEGAETG
jgi:hypothetical protein